MCKCLFKFLKCIAVTLNVIFFIIGLALFAGGIYAKTKVDVKEIFGQKYKDQVPPVEKFAPKGNDAVEKSTEELQKQADEFIDKGLNDLATAVQKLITAVIIGGIFMAAVALFGIIAFTCCNKKNCCVFIFMIIVIIICIPFIVLMAFTASSAFLRGLMFEQLDNLAYKKDFVNRYFMAAVQDHWECCAVRHATDYFCRDTYDYVCNSGCKTMKKFWTVMDSTPMPPVCKKDPTMTQKCKDLAEKMKLLPTPSRGLKAEDCEKKLNVQKPIKGKDVAMCKAEDSQFDGQDSEKSKRKAFLKEFAIKVKEQFKKKDPADGKNDTTNDFQFAIFGSPLQDPKRDKILERPGCGYKIWTLVDTDTYLNYAFIGFLVIFLLLLFQIVVAVLSFCHNRKMKKDKNKNHNSRSKSRESFN